MMCRTANAAPPSSVSAPMAIAAMTVGLSALLVEASSTTSRSEPELLVGVGVLSVGEGVSVFLSGGVSVLGAVVVVGVDVVVFGVVVVVGVLEGGGVDPPPVAGGGVGGAGVVTVYDAPLFEPRISWLVVLLATVDELPSVNVAVPSLPDNTVKLTLATSRLEPDTADILPRAILTDPPPPVEDASIAKALPVALILWNCRRLEV